MKGAATHVLGISAFYHDSAACLLRDGEIVAAVSEDRFTRRKGDASFPAQAVCYCLEAAGITIDQVDQVGFYDKPLLKFERIIETYLGVVPGGFGSFLKAGPLWMKEKLFTDSTLRRELGLEGRILYAEHHESHAASAFYPSPFEEAAILTMDGVGEWATTTVGHGEGSDITLLRELHWPDSLGLLYSAFTYYLGFRINSGEYKVMGLAPYGEPRYARTILDELMDLRDDGSFTLDQRYFGYLSGLRMTNGEFDRLFGGPPRKPESELTRRDLDIARSIQDVCEEVMLRMARTAHEATGSRHLCMAGGVALNCVGNGRILREGPFERIWIQPAAGDAGGSLGVAQLIWHRHLGRPRTVVADQDGMRGAYLGPGYGDDDVRMALERLGARYERLDRTTLLAKVAELLATGAVIGWFRGRAEFGPRALGARSILADPRDPSMRTRVNERIKLREQFRPFAPSVPLERAAEYFDLDVESPYMLLVAPVRGERRRAPTSAEHALDGLDRASVAISDIPAVTHVDGSARIQTVRSEDNADFHALLTEFETLTGCAVLLNTSFNLRGEPIVCTPEDAYRCFMRSGIDHLVIESFLLVKEEQPQWIEEPGWREQIELD